MHAMLTVALNMRRYFFDSGYQLPEGAPNLTNILWIDQWRWRRKSVTESRNMAEQRAQNEMRDSLEGVYVIAVMDALASCGVWEHVDRTTRAIHLDKIEGNRERLMEAFVLLSIVGWVEIVEQPARIAPKKTKETRVCLTSAGIAALEMAPRYSYSADFLPMLTTLDECLFSTGLTPDLRKILASFFTPVVRPAEPRMEDPRQTPVEQSV